MVSPIRTRLIQSVADAQTSPDPQPVERVPFIVASARALAVGEQLLEEAVSLGAVRSMIRPEQVELAPGGVRLEVPDPDVLREDARELTYALGALLYAWVTGQAPPRRQSMPMAHERALRKALAANGVDGPQAELVRKLMGWDTTRRPWPEAALVLLRAAGQAEDEVVQEETPHAEDAADAADAEDAADAADASWSPTPDLSTAMEPALLEIAQEFEPEPPTELAAEPPTELIADPSTESALDGAAFTGPAVSGAVFPGPVLTGPILPGPVTPGPVLPSPDLYSVAYDQEILFFPEHGAPGDSSQEQDDLLTLPAGGLTVQPRLPTDPGDTSYFPSASSDVREHGFSIPDHTRVVNFPRLFPGSPEESVEDEITDSEGFARAGEDDHTDPENAGSPVGLNMDETNPSSFVDAFGSAADRAESTSDEHSTTEASADEMLEPVPAPSQIRLESAATAPAAARRTQPPGRRSLANSGLGRLAALSLLLLAVAAVIVLATR